MWNMRVLTILVLLVEYAKSFDWDIVAGNANQLKFYYNGIPTHTKNISSAEDITSVTYDAAAYRLIFVDENTINGSMTIYSFDLTTRAIRPLVKRTARDFFPRAVYDPVRQLLFWKENKNIYSVFSSPASSNVVVDGNLLFTIENYCHDIAVDSCGGYIYWITDFEIERARFDGSGREVLLDSVVSNRGSLTIDQQTQKIYWTETILTKKGKDDLYKLYLKSADFNGKNRKTVHIVKNYPIGSSLTVSKDFFYWGNNELNPTISKLPKNPQGIVKVEEFAQLSHTSSFRQRLAANYTIEEQTWKIKNCKTLRSLQSSDTESELTDAMFCVKGTKVSGGSRCQCVKGYTGERCDVSICQNYCLQGDCSVSTEGRPSCSCKAGYFGERCEVNACHKHCFNNGVCSLNETNEPVCHCTAGYIGERCAVSVCKDYCFQGDCSVSAEGKPKCSCKGDYSGARCEVNPCQEYCLNGGVCSLDEEEDPHCRCTKGYEGTRCDVPASLNKCLQTVSMLRDIFNADATPVTPGTEVQFTCKSTII